MLQADEDAAPSSQTPFSFEVRTAPSARRLALTATAGGLLCGLAVVLGGRPAVLALLAVAGAVVLGLACLLAAFRFEAFVLLLLVVRPSLDRLPLQVGPLDVSSVLALVFLVAGTAWLAVGVRRSPVRWTPMSFALVAFAGVAGLSSLVSANPLASAVAASKTASGVLMFLVLERLLREAPDRARAVVTAVLASAVVPCLFGLLQASTGATMSEAGDELGRITGTFVHPNPFATYLAIVLVLASAVLPRLAFHRDRLLVLAVVGLAGVTLMLTFSRGGWIAALVGLAYLLGTRSRALLALAGVLVVLAGLFVPPVQARLADIGAPPPVEGVPANSLEWRLGYWQEVLPLAGSNPLTGIGLEGVQATTPSGLPPHNAYVQAYVETGALGVLALLAVVVAGYVTLRRRRLAMTAGLDRTLALTATAVALGLLAQTLTENLLTQTMALWYFAAAATWGAGRTSAGPLHLSLRVGRPSPVATRRPG